MPQINLKVSDDLNARIEREAGGKRERASWIRELIRDELGPDTDAEPDTAHYPEKDRDRKVYEALLEEGDRHVLEGYIRLPDVLPEMAQRTGVGKDAIYQSLRRMERNNHVRLDEGGVYSRSDSGYNHVRVRARPSQADPDKWTLARGRDRGVSQRVFETQPDENISHARALLLADLEDVDDEIVEIVEEADAELDLLEDAEAVQEVATDGGEDLTNGRER